MRGVGLRKGNDVTEVDEHGKPMGRTTRRTKRIGK
jgi:hypothetical protein